MQENLGLTDRMRWASPFSTSPCMLMLVAPKNESGCDRGYVTQGNAGATPLNEYDAEMVFTTDDEYSPRRKQVPFTCALHALLLVINGVIVGVCMCMCTMVSAAQRNCEDLAAVSARLMTRQCTAYCMIAEMVARVSAFAQVAVRVCRAAADPGPLARTQHLVYMSAFFNLEAEAAARVSTIQRAYNDLKTDAGNNAPVMLWVNYISDVGVYNVTDSDGKTVNKGTAYQVSLASYKVALTSDAGANVVPARTVNAAETAGAQLKEDSANAGEDVTFVTALYDSESDVQSQVHSVLEGVDILIDESFYTSAINVVRFLSRDCVLHGLTRCSRLAQLASARSQERCA